MICHLVNNTIFETVILIWQMQQARNIIKLKIRQPLCTTLRCKLQSNIADFAEQVALPLVTMTTQNQIKDPQGSQYHLVVNNR